MIYISLKHRFLLVFIGFLAFSSFGQDQTVPRKDKDFRLELEPSSVLLRGFAASCTYNLTKWDDINAGVYFATSDIPGILKEDMFSDVDNTTDVRLGMEFALMTRFKLNMFKNKESNPYVGMILGWEYFDIKQPGQQKLRITTGIATPYIGYEIYFYKQMLYVNPQLRGVYYFGTKSDDSTRPETLVARYLLPQISLGIRL